MRAPNPLLSIPRSESPKTSTSWNGIPTNIHVVESWKYGMHQCMATSTHVNTSWSAITRGNGKIARSRGALRRRVHTHHPDALRSPHCRRRCAASLFAPSAEFNSLLSSTDVRLSPYLYSLPHCRIFLKSSMQCLYDSMPMSDSVICLNRLLIIHSLESMIDSQIPMERSRTPAVVRSCALSYRHCRGGH